MDSIARPALGIEKRRGHDVKGDPNIVGRQIDKSARPRLTASSA
jgi:hypothetical protein